MRLLPYSLILGGLLAGCAQAPAPRPATDTAGAAPTPPAPALVYPETRRDEGVVDDYFGVEVADPYRWLEDLDAPETRAWIAAQNRLTEQVLAQAPLRSAFLERLTALWNYERYGVPVVRGGRYFFTRNDGLSNQAMLYWLDRLDGEPRLLLDPNTLSADGTIALADWSVSRDGKLLAYALSSGGSDWREWRVREVDSGVDRPDRVLWGKFSGATWAADGSGFYYSRYAEPAPGEDKLKVVNRNQMLYFHRLGTAQSEDRLVYARPDQPEWGFYADLSPDGRYLIITVTQGTDERNLLFYQDLRDPRGKVQVLIGEFHGSFRYVGNDGPRFWLHTDDGSPRYRLIEVDLRRPTRPHWRERIPQGDATLTEVHRVGDSFFAHYLRDARSEVRRYTLNGAPRETIELPGLGTVAGFDGDPNSRETFYSFASFTTPSTILRYDLAGGRSEVFRRPQVDFDPGAYETRQVFYPSKDGTQVPMFITARKGTPLNSGNPTLLYGYGGFNIPLLPRFSVPVLAWIERGGVYAEANIRGGGEYGRNWHESATKVHRQVAFDDFIAAADHLIAQGWTNPRQLAINGRSNGGLLVAATMVQRPDLFAAAVPAVGVLDMLRFNRFTIGWAWESDYGSPQNPVEFRALYAYSPLHNLRSDRDYPATLILTGDHDDRVFPAHSFKFAAALQHADPGPNPKLIRIETRGGHGAGKPVRMQIEENADLLAFIAQHTSLN